MFHFRCYKDGLVFFNDNLDLVSFFSVRRERAFWADVGTCSFSFRLDVRSKFPPTSWMCFFAVSLFAIHAIGSSLDFTAPLNDTSSPLDREGISTMDLNALLHNYSQHSFSRAYPR